MSGYTKLSSSLVTSTVWRESSPTRCVWITMLALADAHGEVQASIPGLADVSRVTIEECEHALSVFLSPDKYSRTQIDDGRRITPIDGGWALLNYSKYRDLLSMEHRRALGRERAQRFRDKEEVTPRNADVTQSNDKQRQRQRQRQEAEAKATKEQQQQPHDIIANFPATYQAEVAGIIRAAKNPESLVAELNAINVGMHGPAATWEVIGRAVHDMLVAEASVTARTLRAFVSGIVSPPPDRKWKKPEETRPVIGGKVPKAHSDLCQFCVARPGTTPNGRPAVIHDTGCHMYDPSVLPPALQEALPERYPEATP